MKHILIAEIINQIRVKPKLGKKLAIFAIVGFVGVLAATALTVWVGVSVIQFAGTKLQSENVSAHISSLESRLAGIGSVIPVGCWAEGRRLLNPEVLLRAPLVEAYDKLKVACFENPPREEAKKGNDSG